MAPTDVLVVEDDSTLVHAILRNLAVRGYTARPAGSVAEGVSYLLAGLPSLVLLDIDLPDGSGWEVVRHLRSTGGGDVPVIVMSALRPNPRLVAELGCVAMLEKPFPMETLMRLVGEWMTSPKKRGTSHA